MNSSSDNSPDDTKRAGGTRSTRDARDAPSQLRVTVPDYLSQVQSYWDSSNDAYLRCLGTTFQAGYAVDPNGKDSPHLSNLYFAAQAGIEPGDRVLDAGCGVGGPSIDIAGAVEDLTIDAITLSPVQAATANRLVRKAGLERRIRVHIGDYHELPFGDSTFDVVYFFESSGYSYSPGRLFSEVFRVLRPGGTLYIKDMFMKEGDLSPLEKEQMEELHRIFVYLAATMTSTQQTLRGSGFVDVTARSLDDKVSLKRWHRAMVDYVWGLPLLTELGKISIYKFLDFPLVTGEIKAHKPTPTAVET